MNDIQKTATETYRHQYRQELAANMLEAVNQQVVSENQKLRAELSSARNEIDRWKDAFENQKYQYDNLIHGQERQRLRLVELQTLLDFWRNECSEKEDARSKVEDTLKEIKDLRQELADTKKELKDLKIVDSTRQAHARQDLERYMALQDRALRLERKLAAHKDAGREVIAILLRHEPIFSHHLSTKTLNLFESAYTETT